MSAIPEQIKQLMPDEAELERILRREQKDEVAAWRKSVDSIAEVLNERELFT